MNARTLKKHLRYKIPQLRLALIREPDAPPAPAIRTPADAHEYLQPMKRLAEEHFVTLHLNARYEVIGYHLVSQGTVSASLVHPREVYKAALLSNAYAVLLAHNHPGGSSTASPEDIETTAQLIRAGTIMGVSVVDHLIVTHRDIYSIRESHPHLFET